MNFLDWCISHYDLLIEICLTICVILITFFRKKVKINNVLTGLFQVLPAYIKEAENTCLSGEEKFKRVFKAAVEYLVILTGDSADDVVSKYAKVVDQAIENILSTPQKKG